MPSDCSLGRTIDVIQRAQGPPVGHFLALRPHHRLANRYVIDVINTLSFIVYTLVGYNGSTSEQICSHDSSMYGRTNADPASSTMRRTLNRRELPLCAICEWQIRQLDPAVTIFSVPFMRFGLIPVGGRSTAVGRLATLRSLSALPLTSDSRTRYVCVGPTFQWQGRPVRLTCQRRRDGPHAQGDGIHRLAHHRPRCCPSAVPLGEPAEHPQCGRAAMF